MGSAQSAVCCPRSSKLASDGGVVLTAVQKPSPKNAVLPEQAPQASPRPDEARLEGIPPSPAPERKTAIAIVGIGCRAPGADNIREFWRVLANGECHVTDVPADRWNSKAYYDPDPLMPGKAYSHRGGFVKNPAAFDSHVYDITSYEASHIGPQQRLMLDCTFMALEEAGITRAQISGTNTGVFVGSSSNDHMTTFLGSSYKMAPHTASGVAQAILSARISYVFNLLGPCMVVDTACSSSLVTLHLACQAILTGDCDMAICGGVNFMSIPDMHVLLCKSRMLSRAGLCQTFSSKADGYVRGEACGVIILKRLEDAVRDGDNVLATVCTGTNQDGRMVSPITSPSGVQQKKLLKHVYDRFGLDVNQVDYIEAHGTGTRAGDPVEANALGEFFLENGNPRNRFIGSLKTNIGHTEGAAGVMSVIKVLLMMKHGTIVPSLHCDVVNPKINVSGLKLTIPQQCIPWDAKEKFASCNSFGFGGSNAHAVLTHHANHGKERKEASQKPCIVCFSAGTKKSLRGTLEDLYSDKEAPLLDIHDVSFTSTTRRDHYKYRTALVVQNTQDLLDAVRQKLSSNDFASPAASLDTVFVFSGMGTTWPGMCREMLAENAVFRKAIRDVDVILSSYVTWSLEERLQKGEDPSQDAVFGPIAIFACQVALVALWQSLGVKPSRVVGQSVGEVAAAFAAGCLELAEAVKIIFHRSKILAEIKGGSMVVVKNVSVDRVKQAVAGTEADVSLEYSPVACAVSASSDVMPGLKRHLLTSLKDDHRDMQLIDLKVSVAFHSRHVHACGDRLATVLQGLKSCPPTVPFVSAVTGLLMETPPDVKYWADNLRKPVLFRQAMNEAMTGGNASQTVCLEIGPKPVLAAHLKDLFPKQQCQALPSMSTNTETNTFLKAVVAFYELGADISWKNLPTYGTRPTSVPRYAFDNKYCWETTEMEAVLQRGCDTYGKSHLFTCPSREGNTSFSLFISPLCVPSVYDHVVSGRIIIPGALYAEAGFAVARYMCPDQPVAVSVDFQHPVMLKKKEVMELEVHLESDASVSKPWQQKIVIQKNDRLLATIKLAEVQPQKQELINVDRIKSRCKDTLDKSQAYALLARYGFQYGEAFSLIESVQRNSSECLSVVKLNDTVRAETSGTVIHPCIIDCMFQSASFITVDDTDAVKNALPKAIGKLTVHGAMEQTMLIHARLNYLRGNILVCSYTLLSLTGRVLAQLDEHSVHILLPEGEPTELPMLAIEWDKALDLQDTQKTRTAAQVQQKGVIVITDSENGLKEEDGPLTIVRFNCADENSLPTKAKFKEIFSSSNEAMAVVFFLTDSPDDNADGAIVHLSTVNLCCLVQTVLLTLREMSLTLPFYVFSFNAWPAADSGNEGKINPVASALCGALRAIFLEQIHPQMTAVDLHVRREQVTASFLQNTVQLLTTEASLSGHPEVMVTPEAVYVNQLLQVSPSAVLSEKQTSRTEDFDVQKMKGENIFVSNQGADVSDLIAVAQEQRRERREENFRKMRVQKFAKPPEDLWRLKVGTDCFLSQKQDSAAYVVTALEVSGELTDAADVKVASCFPVAVGTVVSVPAETMIPADCIPDYRVGDLSKLAILWALQKKVTSDKVTILASAATKHITDLLQIILTSANKITSAVITVEEVGSVGSLSGTILSLVLLDTGTLAALAQRWEGEKCLISCSCLLSPEAMSFLACVAPTAEARVVDTQLLFRPTKLIKFLPEMYSWLEQQRSLASKLAEALHKVPLNESSSNMNCLMAFQSHSLDTLQIKIADGGLFQKDAAYIVVGGLTGLGWMCVQFLAENNAGYIAIFNRRLPPQARLAEMENLSHSNACRIEAFQADITQMSSLKEAFQQFSNASARFALKGVFTGAAILEDGPFPTMDRGSFDRSLAPKVRGTWNLHQLTKNIALDYFVTHSSVTAVLGNVGQANYAAGNAFMDGLAFYRRQRGLAAKTINWGPLNTGLLDTVKDPGIKKRYASMGFRLASEFEIKQNLGTVLSLGQTQVIPAGLNLEVYAQSMARFGGRAFTLRLQKVAPGGPELKKKVFSKVGDPSKIGLLCRSERAAAYGAYLRELASSMMTLDTEHISDDASLSDLGLDSVLSMMLINQVHKDTGIMLSAVDVLAGEVTLASVAHLLTEYSENDS